MCEDGNRKTPMFSFKDRNNYTPIISALVGYE